MLLYFNNKLHNSIHLFTVVHIKYILSCVSESNKTLMASIKEVWINGELGGSNVLKPHVLLY